MTDAPFRIAAFVKTPGHSAIKTRLAAQVGAEQAAVFYSLAVAATRELLEEAQRLGLAEPYWAVAEPGAEGEWASLNALSQGEGGLGHRLGHVYSHLRLGGGMPCLIGADAPSLSVDHLRRAKSQLDAGAAFVLGPAADGGFYLFAGKADIPKDLWRGITYSASSTADELVTAVSPLGRIAQLDVVSDVDTAADLQVLRRALASEAGLLPAQKQLLAWLGAWTEGAAPSRRFSID